jgi:biopolymer transport protein ExbD
MRRPSTFHRKEEIQLKMTTLIDVVFLLLVFFVWTSTFKKDLERTKQTQLSVSAGSSSDPLDVPPPAKDFDDVVIRLFWEQQRVSWRLNDEPVEIVSFDDLGQKLRRIAAIKNDVPVIVDPDGEVPFEEVVRVYDAAESAGFQQVGLAVAEGG